MYNQQEFFSNIALSDNNNSLLLPPTPIDTYLGIPPSIPPSPTGSDASTASYCSNTSDEEFTVPMDQLNFVKKLLRMFPPPMSAEEFIEKNPFKSPEGHVKRPSNNFILFRKIAHDQKNQTPELSGYNEREFSRIIGKIWKTLNNEEKLTYERLGKDVAEKHKKLFPKYKYQPKRDRAAWKHFNPETNNSIQKQKRKNNKVKQQKQQEIIQDIPEININVPNLEYDLPSNTQEVIQTIPVDLGQIDPINYYPYVNANGSYFNLIFNDEGWWNNI